jgi:hypothetical protein
VLFLVYDGGRNKPIVSEKCADSRSERTRKPGTNGPLNRLSVSACRVISNFSREREKFLVAWPNEVLGENETNKKACCCLVVGVMISQFKIISAF